MPETATDPPAPSCYRLYRKPRFQESQLLGPDLFLPRARDARAFSPREAPAIRAAGLPAFPIRSGACPIFQPGR
jgi:hypothetical protein